MSLITERQRLDLVHQLETVLGTEATSTLMEYLPASGWRDVATTTDLESRCVALGSELRSEMHTLGTELRTEMAELRTETRTGFADVRQEMANQFQRMTITYVGALVSVAAIVVAATNLARP